MIAEMASRFSRSALTIAVALTVSFPLFAPDKIIPQVYTNPRSGADDPRVGLKAGLYDAGEAASGLQRLVSLPKPAGFAPDLASIAAFDASLQLLRRHPPARRRRAGRRLVLAPTMEAPTPTWHSAATTLFVGNYSGINFYDISNPAKIKLITSVVCPGGQGDVSVYGHLLFMSVEAANGRLDCGIQGFPTPAGAAPAPPPPPRIPPRCRGRTAPATAAASQPGPHQRHPHLRHHRHLAAEAGRRGPDLPRFAHAHARHRPERQGQYLRLYLRIGRRASRRGTGRLLGRRSRSRTPTRRCSPSSSSRCRWPIPSRPRSSPARASSPIRRPAT